MTQYLTIMNFANHYLDFLMKYNDNNFLRSYFIFLLSKNKLGWKMGPG